MKYLFISVLVALFHVKVQSEDFGGLAAITSAIEEYLTPIQFDCSEMGERHKEIDRNQVFIQWHNTRTNRMKMYTLHKAFSLIEKEFDFDRREKTYVYIHGYTESANSVNSILLKNALDTLKNVNYFLVDYKNFAKMDIFGNSKSYSNAVSSLYGVGQLLGDFLVDMVRRGLRQEDLYVFGFSLGAQTTGYAARRFYKRYGKKLHRITGLDPAGPCFNDVDISEQISSADALYVDIYHTDSGSIGTVNSFGNATFFVNSGGNAQTSCIPIAFISEFCSHSMIEAFWVQSIIDPHATMALECDSYEHFEAGKCYGNKAVTPGFFSTPTNGRFFIVYSYDFDYIGQFEDKIENGML